MISKLYEKLLLKRLKPIIEQTKSHTICKKVLKTVDIRPYKYGNPKEFLGKPSRLEATEIIGPRVA